MKVQNPKLLVSIIIPLYNQAEYLSECIQSVLDQSYEKWECIIVDDGSTDDSGLIATLFVERDDRITYLRKENGGLSSARNFGVNHCMGEFILPLDADDKIAENYIEIAVDFFCKNSEISLVYGRAYFFGAINKEWELPTYNYKSLLFGNQIYCSSIYRRNLFKLAGGYDESMKQGFEDWDFLIRCLDGQVIRKLEYNTFFYRIKEDSMMKILNANRINYYKTKKYIYYKNIDKYKKYCKYSRFLYLLKYNVMIFIHNL